MMHKIEPEMTLKMQVVMALIMAGPQIWLQAFWSITEFTVIKNKNKPVA